MTMSAKTTDDEDATSARTTALMFMQANSF